MPLEFPEAELEAIAKDCDQAALEWGAGRGEIRQKVAQKWAKKAAVIRQAIDAYRERMDAPPITRRQKFAALVEGLAEQMETPDRKTLAANDR